MRKDAIIGALVIIGFWGPVFYNKTKDPPPKKNGIFLGPYIRCRFQQPIGFLYPIHQPCKATALSVPVAPKNLQS